MFSLTKRIVFLNVSMPKRFVSLKKDPGINKRINAISDGRPQNTEEMDIDDLESDFFDVHNSYKEHIREVDAQKSLLKYNIVRQKYFKEKYPNFLTWHDKEQIKFLHNTNPDEWTVEKLTDSFPALPETIKKILKSNYTKSENRIKNHDTMVEKNWILFKRGKLYDLPPTLVEHLNKFTERKLNANIKNIKKTELINKPIVQSEFAEIISRYSETMKNEKTENKTVDIKVSKNKSNKDNYLLINKRDFKNKSLTTLTELQENIQTKATEGHHLTEEEQIIYKNYTANSIEDSCIDLNQKDILALSNNKYNVEENSLVQKTKRNYTHLMYPEKIIIPKELKKNGYTYKLNDCYYDFDGEFLYRVPGMD